MMTHYKHEAKQASHDKMKRMGLHKDSTSKHFDDVHPYDGVPQLSTETPAGQPPVGKQRFRRGGKVADAEGAKAKQNLGRKPRKPAGDSDHYAGGGVAAFSPALRKKRAAAMAIRKKKQEMGLVAPTFNTAPPMRKHGGKVEHEDVAADKKLIRSMVKGKALKHGDDKYCWGGRAKKADGGGMRSESTQYAKAKRDASDAYYDSYPNTFSGMAKNLTSPEKWMDQGARLSETRRNLQQAGQETGGYKKGGRAHKLSGGSLGNYINKAAAQRGKAEELIGNLTRRDPTGAPTTKPYKDMQGLADRRTKGMAMAASKMFGTKGRGVNVPASDDESPMKRGGRAHKLSGGALERYIDKAAMKRAGAKRGMEFLERNNATGEGGMGTYNKFKNEADRRTKGIAMAASKLHATPGRGVNVPASDDEAPMKHGGRAHRKDGGRTKGKTNINIIVAPEGSKGSAPAPAGGPPAIPPALLAAMAGGAPGGMPPGGAPMGAPPPGALPSAGAGPGLGAMGSMAPGKPGMSAPVPPMAGGAMGRKSGGRVNTKAPQAAMPKYQEHDYGSGSGLGRLEKRKWPLAK
jgi:hypothetical protein